MGEIGGIGQPGSGEADGERWPSQPPPSPPTGPPLVPPGQGWPLAPLFYPPPPPPPPSGPPPQLPERRLLKQEVVIVMAIGLLGSTVAAVIYLVRYLANGQITVLHQKLINGHVGLDVLAESLAIVAGTVAVTLVWYVLQRSGETLASIGLRFDTPGRDIAVAIGLALIMFFTAGIVISIIHGLGAPSISSGVSGSVSKAYLPVFWLASARAGILEEVFVCGYLLHRLRQLGWSDNRALVASVVVRSSYHLYGGVPLVAFTVLFGFVMANLYQRTHRLLPIILAHAFYDGLIYTVYVLSHSGG